MIPFHLSMHSTRHVLVFGVDVSAPVSIVCIMLTSTMKWAAICPLFNFFIIWDFIVSGFRCVNPKPIDDDFINKHATILRLRLK